MLRLDPTTLQYIQESYLLNLTLPSSPTNRFKNGTRHDGIYGQGSTLMNNWIHNNSFQQNTRTIDIFLKKYCSGSDEMSKWFQKIHTHNNNNNNNSTSTNNSTSSNQKSSILLNVSCYNIYLEMLRIEGNEEKATYVLDHEMDLYDIVPNEETWNILQNNDINWNKKRGEFITTLQSRNDPLCWEAAEHLLFQKLIPRGISTTW